MSKTGEISEEEQVADKFLQAFRNDRFEVNIGKVKLLRLINRISPGVADKTMRGGL